MAKTIHPHKAPKAPRVLDWVLFAIVVVLGGSSFAMIRTAVETVPPIVIGSGRLWIGAALLYGVMKYAGRSFPPLVVATPKGRQLHKAWAYMIAVGTIGMVLPFFIFPWAQQHVDSGLAGIYMAFMPIWTLILAFFFANESLGAHKIAGFALAFAGIVVLIGTDVLSGVMQTNVLAQGSLLLATLLYAASAVLARRAPRIRPRVFAAGMMLSAAIVATPALVFADFNVGGWSLESVASIFVLGIGSTGISGLVIIILINRAGAGFMALSNYVTPIWAVALGAVLLHERLDPRAFIALGIILTGLAISQRLWHSKRKGAPPVSQTGDGLAAELTPTAIADTNDSSIKE